MDYALFFIVGLAGAWYVGFRWEYDKRAQRRRR